MNYACRSERPFVITKPIKKKTVLSEQARSIRDYTSTHTVSISVNPDTHEAIAQVMERKKTP